MILNFVLQYFKVIVLSVWALFFAFVVMRAFGFEFIKNISYKCLLLVAALIHILYGVSATVLQYIVFSKSEIGKVLLSIPLPKEVPFPWVLEWVRPMFSGAHGYFAFYSFQHFFLSAIVLFFITALFALFFKMYARYRPALFKEGDITIIAIAFLVAGYLGALVLVPLSLVFALLIALSRARISSAAPINLALVFLLMAPLALLFAIPLLALVDLYPLLKI